MTHSVSQLTQGHMTVDQYLAFERQSPARHEYLAGEVFAMTGSSAQHNAIANRLFAAIVSHLRGSPWQALSCDVKVRVRTNMRDYFYYPDVSVISETDRRAEGGDGLPYVRGPRLIIEVISPTTESIDRREKMMMYREITALEEYVLVAQDEHEVTLYRRRQSWRPVVNREPTDLVELRSIGLSLPLAHIYRDAPARSVVP